MGYQILHAFDKPNDEGLVRFGFPHADVLLRSSVMAYPGPIKGPYSALWSLDVDPSRSVKAYKKLPQAWATCYLDTCPRTVNIDYQPNCPIPFIQ